MANICQAPVPMKLKVGEYLDVEALLDHKSLTKRLVRYSDRTGAVFQSIRDKYLVIICISLPLPLKGDFNFQCYEAIKAAYGELCKLAKGEFEMITVAKMDADDVTAFEEFFITVPGLAVPYYDLDSRDYVCDTLGLGTGSSTKRVTMAMAGVILDKGYKVLRNDDFWNSFSSYGAAFYPFTNDKLKALEATLDALQRRLRRDVDDNTSGSLMDLLSCDRCRKLKRLRPRGGDSSIDGEEEISVGELSKYNCVGVYLCASRSLLPKLASVYEECKARNLKFEIVVACQSWTYDPPDIQDFERVSRVLESTSSWWMLDWTDANSRWLRRLCRDYYVDNLFIVRPEGCSWERDAKSILRSDGITSYPFTKDSICERMTSLTVDSLLRGCADPNLLARLSGKNVLVYLGLSKSSKETQRCRALEFLRNTCNNDNCLVPDLQVVFVSADGHDALNLSGTELAQWHVLSLPRLLVDEIVERVFTMTLLRKGRINTVVAFGKDGRLLSRYVQIYHRAFEDIPVLFGSSEMPKADADILHKEIDDHFVGLLDDEDENPFPCYEFDNDDENAFANPFSYGSYYPR